MRRRAVAVAELSASTLFGGRAPAWHMARWAPTVAPMRTLTQTTAKPVALTHSLVEAGPLAKQNSLFLTVLGKQASPYGFGGLGVIGLIMLSITMALGREEAAVVAKRSADDTAHALPRHALEFAGLGEGDSGHRVPNMYKFDKGSQKLYAYVKRVPRAQLVNELVGHDFTELVFKRLDSFAPRAYVVEDHECPIAQQHTKDADDGHQRVSLKLASTCETPDHLNLELLNRDIRAGKLKIDQLSQMQDLGVSLVIMNAFDHGDRQGRNVAIYFDASGNISARPIDYESLNSTVSAPKLNFDWVRPAEQYVTDFLDAGALLDTRPLVNVMRHMEQESDCSDKFITADIRMALESAITREVLSGRVESAYQVIADMTDNDLRGILAKVEHYFGRDSEEYAHHFGRLQERRANCVQHLDHMHRSRADMTDDNLRDVMQKHFARHKKGTAAYDHQWSELVACRDEARRYCDKVELLDNGLATARCGL